MLRAASHTEAAISSTEESTNRCWLRVGCTLQEKKQRTKANKNVVEYEFGVNAEKLHRAGL